MLSIRATQLAMNSTRLLTASRATLRRQRLADTLPAHQQCRTLSLYRGLVAKTTLGSHGIKNWLPYEFPPPHQVEINIQASDPARSKSPLKLHEVLKDMQPGSFIHNSDKEDPKAIKKALRTPKSPKEAKEKSYKISSLTKSKPPTSGTKGTKDDKIRKGKGGPFKRFFFTPSSANSVYFAERMKIMYKFMEHNLSVEVSLSAKSLTGLEEMVKENPQLHPQAIVAAMPKMSGIIVNPQTNGKKISWLMKGPRKAKDMAVNPQINGKKIDWVTEGSKAEIGKRLTHPTNRTAEFDKFRDMVNEDLERSAERGSRPDVVDTLVATSRSYESRKRRLIREAMKRDGRDVGP